MSATDEVILGMRDVWGEQKPFGLLPADRRHHLYVIGKTGSGKTTLLRNMILQDIEAGRGVGLIDPHGDLAAEVLEHIPRHRIEDVVYFDPSDEDFPVALNLLAGIPKSQRHLVASGIVSALKGIWSESWGPRMEYILYATVAALLECENVSLLGVSRMFTDEAFRAWVVKQVKDPVVRSFWVDEFARYDRRFLQDAVAPIQNKVGQLLMSSQLRNVLGQVQRKIDARFMMDGQRIFVANLCKGKLGADKANLMGALLVTQFQLAAMARADVPEAERTDFYLYVDEFQSFISETFAHVLSEARKYGLCLTLAHQYLDQLKPSVADAVMGNVGSMISFRIGHRDAEAMELALGKTYAPHQFTGLSNGELFAKLLNQGRDQDAFMGTTFPPGGTRYGHTRTILERSRVKYTAPRKAVESRLARWFQRDW
jgi:type IV secretory pathway TraG/TraD family ATPase VirD4